MKRTPAKAKKSKAKEPSVKTFAFETEEIPGCHRLHIFAIYSDGTKELQGTFSFATHVELAEAMMSAQLGLLELTRKK